jgi:hypothetical protein
MSEHDGRYAAAAAKADDREPDEQSRETISPVAIIHIAGKWLAAAAARELTAMSAFARLHEELLVHGARDALAEDALLVAQEKARNARTLGVLARRYRAVPLAPLTTPNELRSLHLIAIANITEGVVNGAFSALVGLHQARNATDETVRAALARIARDQVRHAELAWRIARWLDEHLSETGRRAVEAAKKRAIARLCFASDRGTSAVDGPVRELLGLPSAPATAKILAELDGFFT